MDDAPPPATAATVHSSTSPAGQADLGGPLPPGAPIPPGDGPPAGAEDGTRYASGEYAIGADTDTYDDQDPSALSDFRQPLDPYGTWADDPTYGTVWVPAASAVGTGFTPYVSAGHWAYDNDYVWVSDYPWGWAPFHYGRWVLIEGRGWAWIPGREYRGAWVEWSVDDGYSYLGWAPMGPEFVWFGGVAVGYRGYWGPRWAYCPRADVFAPRIGARVIAGPGAAAIAGRMRPYAVANVRVGGPPPARFGYTAAQVPRVTATASVTRAQEFARPSTAQALGARPPARVAAAPAANGAFTGARPPLTGARPPLTGARPSYPSPVSQPNQVDVPRTSAPPIGAIPRTTAAPSMSKAPPSMGTAANVGRTQAAPAPAPARAPAMAPSPAPFRGGGSFHGGGGHHR